MCHCFRQPPLRWLLCSICGAVAVGSGWSVQVWAVTPESPEVQQLVTKGLAYLETADDVRLGGKCLVGLAALKAGVARDDPRLTQAVEACQEVVRNQIPTNYPTVVYNIGLATIFLCDLDPERYRREIDALWKTLCELQKNQGGWGYPELAVGDTSVTQYAVLSAWSARQAGIDVPIDVIERVANWLLRTQDPTGGWGYRGNDPGGSNLVPQEPLTVSLAAAGLGSVFVCADMLDLVKFSQPDVDSALPAEFERMTKKTVPQAKQLGTNVDQLKVVQAVDRGKRWFQSHYVIDPPRWTYYYLYALERYQSFRQLSEGRQEAQPQWYKDGYDYLRKTQKSDGSWQGPGLGGAAVDTSFAILFLIRSTAKSIQKSRGFGDGVLTGGRGLPRNVIDVRLRRGRIVRESFVVDTEALIDVLSDPEHPDYVDLIETTDQIVLGDKTGDESVSYQGLRTLVTKGTPEARRLAVSALARNGNLDEIPALIYALTDPDWRVVMEARDGLRFISRKFDGFGLEDRPSETERTRAVEQWKDWYLILRPDAELEP